MGPTLRARWTVGIALWAALSASLQACTPEPDPHARLGVSSSTQCVTCHRGDYERTANPPHVAAGIPMTCGDCHSQSAWRPAIGGTSGMTSDPAHDLVVTGLVPTYSGTTVAALRPVEQTLHMTMDHASTQIDPSASSACTNCHADAASGSYFPGNLHSSLGALHLPQPTECSDCHTSARPVGFVGPLATMPARSPASGEMKHDAVAWDHGAPTTTPIVTADCGTCHTSPSERDWAQTWATNRAATGHAEYHAPLTAAGLPQPTTCLDCHANSRPTTMLTASNSSLVAGLTLDHQAADMLGECASCHTSTSTWQGGKLHLLGSATPTTCLPCHDGERPTSSTGWRSSGWDAKPFDYGTNANGVTHGAGEDCVGCHNGPGTGGSWGGTQSWQGGHFEHAGSALAASTCVSCHTTQRPDLLPGASATEMARLLGFDHATSGTGDCIGCHQATVRAGSYEHLNNPATGALLGGDWKDGQAYPGSLLVSSHTESITVTQLTLQRATSGGLVTGTTSTSATLYNAISHTSSGIPAQVAPGTPTTPDYDSCWHCHASTGTTVTSYAAGRFHDALDRFSATPGGPVTPLPQPTSGCNDCHAQMLPTGIVQRMGSTLQPMDHAAQFVSPVTIGGVLARAANDLDCAACHRATAGDWDDGVFHANIGTAEPQDCTVCHYTGMADGPRADLTNGMRYAMRHRSGQITFQNCKTCHTGALARATATPLASTQWNGGAYHASLATQPTACIDCHQVSEPTAPTASSVRYTFTEGATATNGTQWMSHASTVLAGRDCAACHAREATRTVTAWTNTTALHGAVTTASTTCAECHGLRNGGGSTPGTNNNLPYTTTSSVTATSASAATGVPSTTRAQISHTDINVTGRDCGACHTQIGASTSPTVRGHEWEQARFHSAFSAGSPLVTNGTTGRCSHCHLNEKPRATYAMFDHAPFTDTSATDCSACHSYPGTGTTSAPNWLGAAAAPMYINVGGFLIPQPPATASGTMQRGIANLPHPAASTCTTCHSDAAGGRHAIGYDHASTLINQNCNSCHEAGSDLIGTPWNGATSRNAGAGDTRPITMPSDAPNHFYPVDCGQCHNIPTGNGLVTTGTTYRNVWRFPHQESKMTNPSTCVMCHTRGIPD